MDNKPCTSPTQKHADGKNCCSLQTQTLARGILAILFGLFFIGLAYHIVLRVILFGTGIGLIYYGFRVLGVTQITDYLDKTIARIKNNFWQ